MEGYEIKEKDYEIKVLINFFFKLKSFLPITCLYSRSHNKYATDNEYRQKQNIPFAFSPVDGD